LLHSDDAVLLGKVYHFRALFTSVRADIAQICTKIDLYFKLVQNFVEKRKKAWCNLFSFTETLNF